jgi:imidazolonepropionase-like amidohydrolase/Tol biopolymer transport system component
MKFIYLTLLLLLSSIIANAQKWNVEAPPGTSKKVTITTSEGTWMDVDVSPNGKTIVFDLLGDIYSMPITGGKATLLAGGKAWEIQPRFSPDGTLISYTSDKGGSDNIWVMNADGSNKHSVTSEDYGVNNASWTADGQYLVVRKNAMNNAGASSIWLYNKYGGDGIQLIDSNNGQNAGEPIASPDGQYIYWSTTSTHNKNPNKVIYDVRSLNRESGEVETVTGYGGCRPQLSPDGKLLAFVRRVRLKSAIYLRNINTGEEWPVYNDLSHDAQEETNPIYGLYPNFSWTADSKGLIFYAKGKILNLDITTLNSSPIPFEVTSQQVITDALHYPQKVFQDQFAVRNIGQLTTSPDGKTIAFSAAGYIYTQTLAGGVAARITSTNDFEYWPDFSPDGKSLIYIDWSDELKSSVNRVDLTTHLVTRLTVEKGFYYSPKFSAKGDKIVYGKGPGNEVSGFAFGERPGIYIIPVTGGTPKMIVANGTNPLFTANDAKIYFQNEGNGKKTLMIIDTAGANQKTLYTSAYITDFTPSPDGNWLAFSSASSSYVIPMAGTGGVQDISAGDKSNPLNRVSRDAGASLQWSKDSKSLAWTFGPRYYTRNINSIINGVTTDTTGTDIGMKLKTDVPDGKIAFKNARIISMKGDEVIESGTILIDQNKITAIGKSADVQIPADAKVYDVTGKTIMPGIVDVHARLNPAPDGLSPQQDWKYYANLAYGVTTANDVSANSDVSLNQAEMVKAGNMVGPRIYVTGTAFASDNDNIDADMTSMDNIRNELRGLKVTGAIAVKSDGFSSREQRQQFVAAARELQMEVIPGGASTYFNQMSMLLDGYTGIEHNIPVWPIYKDVKTLWNSSKSAYTPLLIVSNGTQPGENFWYDRTEVWKKQHLLDFMPRYLVDAPSRMHSSSDYGEYGHIDVSKYAKEIADGGTKVNLGSDGEMQGLGAHWEMWMLEQGGMTPLEAIRCATLNGAAYLGLDKEIGSLEPGKLADLIVLDANPLDDIHNTELVKYVMVNGRLYDAGAMNEIGNRDKPRLHFWWQMSRGDMINLPEGN